MSRCKVKGCEYYSADNNYCSWCQTGMTTEIYQQQQRERDEKQGQHTMSLLQAHISSQPQMVYTINLTDLMKARSQGQQPYLYAADAAVILSEISQKLMHYTMVMHYVCSAVLDYWNIPKYNLGGVANCYYATGSVPRTYQEAKQRIAHNRTNICFATQH